MKTSTKSIALLVFSTTLSVNALAADTAQNSGNNQKIIADFKNKLLLLPCVEVTGSPFDGFYNVLMEITGNGSGTDWVVKKVTSANADECDDNPDDTTNTDDLLNSMGMPPLADLIKDDEGDDPVPTQSSSGTQTAIESTITNNINNPPTQ